jgi:hypothetical protein
MPCCEHTVMSIAFLGSGLISLAQLLQAMMDNMPDDGDSFERFGIVLVFDWNGIICNAIGI